MPIQILPAGYSFGSEAGRALGGGLSQGLQEGLQRKQLAQQEKQASESIKQLTGMDLSGLDPETRKVAVAELLKQQGKEQLEQSKFQKKQDLLKSVSQSQNIGERLQSGGDNIQRSKQLSDLEEIDPYAQAKRYAAIDEHDLSSIAREEAKTEIKKKADKEKEKLTKFQADREYHSKVSQPIIDAAVQTIRQAPIKKGLIDQQRRDIASGNVEGMIPFMVDKLGLEPYRNPESARFRTASKDRFVSTLHEVAGANARPNQFIEQQLVSAQPALGRSALANNTVLDLEEFIEDMKNKRSEFELQLAENDREKEGYARNDIAQRADKLMKDYANQRQEKMAIDIRKRYEKTLDTDQFAREIVGKHVPAGTPLTMRAARFLMIKNNDDEGKAQEEAERLGYTIPKYINYEQ